MKQKLIAGQELDLLTSGELETVLKSWGHELTRGAKFRRRSLAGIVDAAGALSIGLTETHGPSEGFTWTITRLSVAAGTMTAAGINVYANDVAPSSLLWAGLGATALGPNASPGDRGLILAHGDNLVIAGTGLTVAETVVVTAQIKEVPQLMEWSL